MTPTPQPGRRRDDQPDDAVLEFLSLLLARATGEVEVRVEDREGERVKVTTVRCKVADLKREAAEADEAQPTIKFSDDYRTAYWFGETIPLTEMQSKVVRLLDVERAKGTPDVGQERLLKECGSDSVKLADVFRGSLAWGRLVVSSQRGVYRINTDGRRPATAVAQEAPA